MHGQEVNHGLQEHREHFAVGVMEHAGEDLRHLFQLQPAAKDMALMIR